MKSFSGLLILAGSTLAVVGAVSFIFAPRFEGFSLSRQVGAVGNTSTAGENGFEKVVSTSQIAQVVGAGTTETWSPERPLAIDGSTVTRPAVAVQTKSRLREDYEAVQKALSELRGKADKGVSKEELEQKYGALESKLFAIEGEVKALPQAALGASQTELSAFQLSVNQSIASVQQSMASFQQNTTLSMRATSLAASTPPSEASIPDIYLKLDGSKTMTGTLAGGSATFSGASLGTLTVTGQSGFAGASTTALSAVDYLSVGTTATSTIRGSSAYSLLSELASGLLVHGSTTLQNFTFVNATGTSATTTNFYASGALTVGGTASTSALVVSGTATTTIGSGGFTIGGSQFLLQEGSGRVGIGTASPSATLDVLSIDNPGTLTTYGQEQPGFIIEQEIDGTLNTGNVGPTLEFRVHDGVDTWTNAMIAGLDNGDWSGELAFLTTLGGGVETASGRRTRTTAMVEAMRISKNGNVGIGTSSPAWLLSVAGDGFFDGNVRATSFTATSTGDVTSLGQLLVSASTTLQNFTAVNSTTTNATTTNLAVSAMASAGSYKWDSFTESGTLWYSGASGALTDSSNLFTNGSRLAVGTSTLANVFNIEAENTTDGLVLFNSNNLLLGNLIAKVNDINTGVFNLFSGGGAPKVSLVGVGVSYFNGGNVGFGSTSPVARLGITQGVNTNAGGMWLSGTDGDYRAVFVSDTSGVLSFEGGDIGTINTATLNAAGAWTNASDRSYKENITDITYGLGAIDAMRPRFYTMKGSGLPQIGFIAQELELVVPEVVDGEEGKKGVSYGNLVAVVVRAVQELNAKVDALALRVSSGVSSATNRFGELFAGTLDADVVYSRSALEVGTVERPAGVTLYDELTGVAKCLTIYDNAPRVAEGKCEHQESGEQIQDLGFKIQEAETSNQTASNQTQNLDTEAPVISLQGNNPAVISQGDQFIDLGAMVADNNDDNLGISVGGDTVDTATPGTYTITYDASDSAGNEAEQKTRTVIVDVAESFTKTEISENQTQMSDLSDQILDTQTQELGVQTVNQNETEDVVESTDAS